MLNVTRIHWEICCINFMRFNHTLAVYTLCFVFKYSILNKHTVAFELNVFPFSDGIICITVELFTYLFSGCGNFETAFGWVRLDEADTTALSVSDAADVLLLTDTMDADRRHSAATEYSTTDANVLWFLTQALYRINYLLWCCIDFFQTRVCRYHFFLKGFDRLNRFTYSTFILFVYIFTTYISLIHCVPKNMWLRFQW